MQFPKLLLGLGLAGIAAAHSNFYEFAVNGQNQGPATCVRLNKDPSKATFPIAIGGSEMACGFTGTEGRARVCPVPDGAEVTFHWSSWSKDIGKGVIDPSHKGPCAVYMKKVDSAIEDTGAGDGWFKIWDQGFDGQKWCTENLIDNAGLLTVKLPEDLLGGYYLLRPELLALHSASNKDNPDPQFYTGCAQIFLESSGDLGPVDTVSIPGYVKMGEPATSWNLYYGMDHNDYPTLGPEVAQLSSGAGGKAGQTEQTEGARPANSVFQNGNENFEEVPDYTDNKSCWESSTFCWNQNERCWKSAVIGTFDGCKILEARCKEIGETCKNNIYPGPPNKGQIIDAPIQNFDGTPAPAPEPGTGENTPTPEPGTEPEEEEEQPSGEEPSGEDPSGEEPSGEEPSEEQPSGGYPAPSPSEDDEASGPGSPTEPEEEYPTITDPPSATVTGADGIVTVYQVVWVTEVVTTTVDPVNKRAAHYIRYFNKHRMH